MTPILAAGFNDVAKTYDVTYSKVALTTGLYMMGLGVGSVIASPTAILYGKRPVYLVSSILFILTSIWCALAPTYAQLATARVFQGMSVSPVECLPSATIAEIFFLHERAFRVGIYTLLLLGGKNLIPLVSAAIIQAKEWRWVFWIVAMVVGFAATLLFLFVAETFWDRTPRPKSRRPTANRSISGISNILHHHLERTRSHSVGGGDEMPEVEKAMTKRQQHLHDLNVHAHFEEPEEKQEEVKQEEIRQDIAHSQHDGPTGRKPNFLNVPLGLPAPPQESSEDYSSMPHLHNLNSPYYMDLERSDDYLTHHVMSNTSHHSSGSLPSVPEGKEIPRPQHHRTISIQSVLSPASSHDPDSIRTPSSPGDGSGLVRYTTNLKRAPALTWSQTLRPWNGRLTHANWFLVALRPFVLFAYPSILWSTMVYSLSVGWLIVLSESVSNIYRNKHTYNFSALGTGLVYLSPFIGGVLGTAVAGKVSDVVIRYMSRRNGGVYEPEFRLIMAIPVLISTAIGLMGYGWSAQEHDKWIVPTVFFGIISFGCSLGSTTAITFAVDSYRHLAGEALVTLNFSKNIFHGLVFSLFFANWLEDDGPKEVFLAIGGIQVGLMLLTVPMYIYGKRGRMWTVRKGFSGEAGLDLGE